MGYKPCLTDPDLWTRPKKRKSDGIEYYDYVILYVDNSLTIGDDQEEVIK